MLTLLVLKMQDWLMDTDSVRGFPVNC